MAKEKETEKEMLSKTEAKREKALAKKEELTNRIEELRTKIAEESDEKAKNKLRKERDELIALKDGIVITDEKVKIPMAASAKKKLQACISIVVIIALLFAYVATGAAKHGFISSLGWPQKAFTGMVLTDNEGKKHGIKVSTYNYYFATYYNNQQQMGSYLAQYGASSGTDTPDFEVALSKQTTKDEDDKTITWAQKYENDVLENIKDVYLYYYAALKANDGEEPEIKDSQKEELQETLDKYQESADNYGFTLSAYLTAAMGKGVDEATFRREATIQYISENYREEYQKELNSKEFTDEEYNTYRDEHMADLVSVDVKYFECSTEDDAVAFVGALKADGSNFAELASQYAKEGEEEQYADEVETTYYNITRSVFQNIGAAIGTADTTEDENGETTKTETYSGLDWLYSEDRKAGDSTNFSTSVVYVLNPVNLSDVHTVTVRHILIQPQSQLNEEKSEDSEETEDDSAEVAAAATASEASDEQWAAAEAKANELLETYRAGEQTAEAFGALAKENSEDSNADDGGIYENVVPNQMVPSFNAWIFDSARKAGDTAVVKTEFGYHVIYFESTSDMTVWQYTAQHELASQDSESIIKEFEDSFTIKKSWPGSCYLETDTDIDN